MKNSTGNLKEIKIIFITLLLASLSISQTASALTFDTIKIYQTQGQVLGAATVVITPSAPPVVTEGATYKFTANIPVSWSLAPGSTGSIDSDGTYHAPAKITANNSVAGCQMLPNDDIFNTRIDSLPIDANSTSLFSQIPTYAIKYERAWGANIINTLTPSTNMSFLYTPQNNGPFQIPSWPVLKEEGGNLASWADGTDHHITSVNTDNCQSSDIYNTHPAGSDPNNPSTNAQSGVKYLGTSFDLPNGASDAAGLELQPLSLHLSEIESGVIKHAVRFTLSNSWIAPRFIWPATANAQAYNPKLFPYGSRLRLKSSFDISKFNPIAQVLLTQLKNYGMVLADGGTSFGIQTDTDLDEDPAVTAAMSQIYYTSSLYPNLPTLNSTNFELVDESSLEISAGSGAVNSGNPYVAPDSYAAVIATDQSNPSNTAQMRVALRGVAVGTAQPFLNIAASASAQLSAWVTGASNNNSVTWSMNPPVGTLTSGGLYIAPAVTSQTTTMITVSSVENPLAKTFIKVTIIPLSADGGIRIKIGNRDEPQSQTSYGPATPITNGVYGPDSKGNMWWANPGALTGGNYPQDNWYGTFWPNIPDVWLYYSGDSAYSDWLYNFAVPNGNYNITLMFDRPYYSSPATAVAPVGVTDIFSLETQGKIVNNNFDLVKAQNNIGGTPANVTLPATVTDGSLYFALRKIAGAPGTTNWGPFMNAFSIVPAIQTSPAPPSPTPTPNMTPPVISTIASTNITQTAATITWLTNEDSDTQTEFGITTSYDYSSTLNPALGLNHTANLVNLTPGTVYHFRVKSRDANGNLSISADNTFTTAASSPVSTPTPPPNPSSPGSWYNPSWGYRKSITINHAKVSAPLNNFPVLVSITDPDLKAKTQSSGADILFTDANTIKLSHEIEKYDSATGQLIAWVNVPSLPSSADTALYLYYGNSSIPDQSNKNAVWDAHYKGVWHLGETSGTSVNDSTATGNTGTKTATSDPAPVLGAIGGAQLFQNGTGKFITTPANSSLDITTSGESYSWMEYDNEGYLYQGIYRRTNSSGDNSISAQVGIGTGNDIDYIAEGKVVTWPGIVNLGSWTYFTLVHNFVDGAALLYKNGVLVSSKSIAAPASHPGYVGIIGDRGYGLQGLDGKLDELRISNTVRSPDWIKTEYNNQISPSTFITTGAAEVYQVPVANPPLPPTNSPSPAPTPAPPLTGSAPGGTGYISGGETSSHAPTPTPAPSAAATPTSSYSNPTGNILKLINSSGTFYLIQNSQKYGITNPGILFSYGFNFADVKPATAQDSMLPVVGLLSPQDGALVKSKGNPTVYLISGQQRHAFASAAVFKTLGFKFNQVLTVTAPELTILPYGSILSNGKLRHPRGVNINYQGTIYYLGASVRYPYPSLTAYNSWNLKDDFSKIVPANAADLALPVGNPVEIRVLQ